MSILKVDTINEKTSGNGVAIPGHVIQKVSASDSTAGNTTSTSATQAWAGTSITPKFSNSLIQIECNFWAWHRDYYDGYVQLYRNGSAISGQRIVVRNASHPGGTFSAANTRSGWYCPFWLWNFTEAAGGTSAITYSVYAWTQDSSQPTYWNSALSNSNVDPTSTMILTEIAQ